MQFVLHLMTNLIALGLIFAKGKTVDVVISVSLVLFLITALISSIFPFILLHKLLFPPTIEEDKKDADGGDSLNLEGISMQPVPTDEDIINADVGTFCEENEEQREEIEVTGL